MPRSHVVLAVFSRNFWSYFSGLIGYLFIVVFVTLGALFAFREQFFTNNLANLDQLNQWFPYLLLFIIPAITMSAWSEEKRQGTDELLFTLPVSDEEVLIGKYLALVAVYTVVLAFSLTHVAMLQWIGDPDWGQIAANYFGYWLAGCALLSCGMVASFLTSSATAAFVLGAVFCALPVLIDYFTSQSQSFEWLSVPGHLKHFSIGRVPFSSLVYFGSLTGGMLFLNRVLIGQRHWSGGSEGTGMGLQYGLRTLSVFITLLSICRLFDAHDYRFDWTAERIYTVSKTTSKLMGQLNKDRPVTIQAFISSDLPREYVSVRTDLLGLLDQYKQLGRGNVTVRIANVKPFTPEADQARQFGVEIRKVQSERGGRIQQEEICLGVVVNSGSNEVVIPFFDVGTPVEYELTRSIWTVSGEKRKTIGILETDAKVTGGFDMSTFRSQPEWRIVTELRKQYNVETVNPASPIDEKKFDVLVAILPSSLNEANMLNFVDYVKKGRPTLIFDDPLPASNPSMAPRQPKPRAGGGGMFGGMGGGPSEPKHAGGKATSLVNLLGIQWNYDEVVFDETMSHLHPEFAEVVRDEMVAISPKSGVATAFNPDINATSGLQELLLFFAGTIRPRENTKWDFIPLLRTGKKSGLVPWDDLIRPDFMGNIQVQEIRARSRDAEETSHVVAALIQPKAASKSDAKAALENASGANEPGVHVIYVADTDLVSDWFFNVRERRMFNLSLDNITFVLNAVDLLGNDETFVPVRKRRSKHRTLSLIESAAASFVEERNLEMKKATDKSKQALEDAEKRLKTDIDKIRNDNTLDGLEKAQRLMIAVETQNRRLEVEKAVLEQDREKTLLEIKGRHEQKIRSLETKYRWWAICVPPIPAILLGLAVWMSRLITEQRDIQPSRRRPNS